MPKALFQGLTTYQRFVKSNVHHTHCVTPKCVMSLQGSSLHHCSQSTLGPCPKFEPQTFCSRNERAAARPTSCFDILLDIQIK